MRTIDLITELRKRLTPEEYATHRAAFDRLANDIEVEGKDAYYRTRPEENRCPI